ncbi:hypothetical protein L596_002143 [Steinernema carpocapsae]|uniref:C4H2-type domain-containing protein n=2 Tax=Steinernema carpocapsae TaxID=34508 RepID=A0A4U8UNM1_STECR|nr:hypothetical protein L596_002143 [Steinernema carpocapsae]
MILEIPKKRKKNGTMEEQLVLIGEASSKVNEFHETLDCLKRDVEVYEANETFLQKCDHCAAGLETERKAHAEELRLINQDINHLEDIIKNLRNSQETKKSHLLRKLAEFQVEIHHTNEFCRSTGVPENQLIDMNVMSAFNDLTNGQLQAEAVIQSNIVNFFPSPSVLFQKPVVPKEKTCVQCNRKIHRNSPVCPFCKYKSVPKCKRYNSHANNKK